MWRWKMGSGILFLLKTNRIYCNCSNANKGTLCEHKKICPYCEKNSCNKNLECTKCRPYWTGKYCGTKKCESNSYCSNNGE